VVPGVLDPSGPGIDVLQSCSSVTFLLHGFNVDRSNGTAELTALANELSATTTGAAVAVLWSGDSVAGPLSYPFETNNADDTAVELTKFIADWLPQRPRLSLVAHSLGCRVAMETVRHLWIKDIPVAQVCLMAAAIDNDSLGDIASYQGAAEHAARVAVLYSPSDRVLRYAYPVGNQLSAFLHWTRTTDAALGYSGPVAEAAESIPSDVVPVGIPAAAGADHGDYLPAATGAINPLQAAAAAFANAVLLGTAPLVY
jgi:esterase/lipase superfamily enzyme